MFKYYGVVKKDGVLLGTVKGLSQLPLVSRESFLTITNIHLYKKIYAAKIPSIPHVIRLCYTNR